MHIVIAGGSGFVGKELQKQLLQSNVKITILTRSPEKIKETEQVKAVRWLTPNSQPETELKDVDVVINLAGESINSGRWTEQRKERILNSRLNATKEISRIISHLRKKPEVLINASAVGYYGMSQSKTFTEDSQTEANDFLAQVVYLWEREAKKVGKYDVRTVCIRFGIVLGKGGALPLMSLPYRFFIGGTIGSGKQWVSWIHVEDLVRLIQFAIDNKQIEGSLNATSEEPVQMKAFGQTVASVLHRPHWLPVPSWVMKIGLGEMSSMMLKGQKVIPQKAIKSGFSFKYGNLKTALEKSLK